MASAPLVFTALLQEPRVAANVVIAISCVALTQPQLTAAANHTKATSPVVVTPSNANTVS